MARRVPRGMLTESELQETGEKAGDGFTTRTTGPGAGRPARNVLSTGFAPKRGRGAEVALTPEMSPAEQIGEFNRARIGTLSTPGASMAIGGWRDPDTGIVGMDTSVITPKTIEGMIAAAHMGVVGGQAAIGNLGPGTAHERAAMGSEGGPYLGDIEIPHYLHEVQFDNPGFKPRTQRIMAVSSSGDITPTGHHIITPGAADETEMWAREKAAELGYSSGLPSMGAEEYLNKYGSSDS